MHSYSEKLKAGGFDDEGEYESKPTRIWESANLIVAVQAFWAIMLDHSGQNMPSILWK